MTAIGAGGARFIGHYLGFTQADYFKRAISHAVFRGTLAKAQGGNFKNGFMSTFFSTMAGIVKVGAGWAQGAWQSMVGGTASVIGGGKFANGAVSAAVTWMLNDNADPRLNRTGIGTKKTSLIDAIKKTDLYKNTARDIKASNNQMRKVGNGIIKTASDINRGLPTAAKIALSPSVIIVSIPVASSGAIYVLRNPVKTTEAVVDFISSSLPGLPAGSVAGAAGAVTGYVYGESEKKNP